MYLYGDKIQSIISGRASSSIIAGLSVYSKIDRITASKLGRDATVDSDSEAH